MFSLYFFCFDRVVKMTVADMNFNIDLFDMHFLPTIIKHRIFYEINCSRFASVMNTTITNTFDSDNNNIAYIKTQNCQIMATIANRISEFKTMIKIPIVTNNTLITVISFSNISSLT